MRIFRVLWARNGAVGFIGQLGEACSGVVGFIVLHAGAFWALGTSRLGTRWGFCSIRNRLAACRRRVDVLMTPFPPFGDGEPPTCGSMVPKVQTTSAKHAENGVLWARWSTFWAQRCLAWRVVRTRTSEHAR